MKHGKSLALVALLGVALAGLWWSTRPRLAYTTQPVARADIEASVTAIGTLQPRRYVDVGAQVSGQITRLKVAAGDTVAKGDLLVELDPSVQRATVDAGHAQLAEQQAHHRLAGQQLERQKQMAADEATRLEDLQNAEAEFAATAARVANLKAQIDQTQATLQADIARLGYTRIYAPRAGTVVSVAAREGQRTTARPSLPRLAMSTWRSMPLPGCKRKARPSRRSCCRRSARWRWPKTAIARVPRAC